MQSFRQELSRIAPEFGAFRALSRALDVTGTITTVFQDSQADYIA